MNRIERFTLLLASCGLVLGLSGCTTPAEPVPEGAGEQVFYDAAGTQKEYQETLKNLELPQGKNLEELPLGSSDDGDMWQKGYGEGEAVYDWHCLWMKEWLDKQGNDPQAEAHALEQMEAVVDTNAYEQYFDPESVQKSIKDYLEKAKLGDTAAIKSEIDSSCRQDLP